MSAERTFFFQPSGSVVFWAERSMGRQVMDDTLPEKERGFKVHALCSYESYERSAALSLTYASKLSQPYALVTLVFAGAL